MRPRHHWHVWDDNQNSLCEGSRRKCLQYYMRNGGSAAGLHLGHWIKDPNEEPSNERFAFVKPKAKPLSKASN